MSENDNPILRIGEMFASLNALMFVVLISVECIFTKLLPHCTLHRGLQHGEREKKLNFNFIDELKFTHEIDTQPGKFNFTQLVE